MHVAQRELRELLRQPALILSSGVVYLLVSALALMLLWILDYLHHHPVWAADTAQKLQALGLGAELADVPAVAATVVQVTDFLAFSQVLGMTAVLGAHGVLHERQSGTLPFLLLAPISRFSLVFGKSLGACVLPMLAYFGLGGAAHLLAISFDVVQAGAPPQAGWPLAFGLAAPAWTFALGSIAVAASAAVDDVRSAQQLIWALVLVLTMGVGLVLVDRLDWPAGEAGLALAGVAAAAAGLMTAQVSVGLRRG